MASAEIIKVGVVTIDVSSIGIKFENFMRKAARIKVPIVGALCTTESPLFWPNWFSFLEHF